MKPEVQPHHYSVDGGSTVWRSERIATPGEVFSLVQMAQSWAMHLEQNASPILENEQPQERQLQE